jgi:1,4-dihydroxy-2-naphthoate octaprenyltransferase
MYNKLTFKAVKELAAPHTWVASIFPVLLGTLLACAFGHSFNLLIFLGTLAVSVLLQSAVNTLNDYMDFVKGADDATNCPDAHDAAMVYHNINPKTALGVAIVFIALAAVLGLLLCLASSFWLLLFGAFGLPILLFYSAGPLPISYTPLGEITSGFVMGGIITMAVYYALTVSFEPMVLYYASPLILTIGLIMLTNNGCDIIKDKEASRHTLPILLGQKNTKLLLIIGFILAILMVAHLGFWHFHDGSPLAIIMAIHCFFYLKAYLKIPLDLAHRRQALGTTLKLVKTINIYYLLIILAEVLLNG